MNNKSGLRLIAAMVYCFSGCLNASAIFRQPEKGLRVGCRDLPCPWSAEKCLFWQHISQD
ncbi:MAG: hypothetical protein ACFNLD_08720 [Kingella oralis]|uniref:hypothetical protein n=1 Tax=Kingella oralis TaxID=505 RepID=UPI0034E5D774